MKNETYTPHKSSIGDLNANMMALLCYIVSVVVSWIPVVRYVAWLVPLLIFFMEKQSNFVKFHALQSFFLNVFSAILTFLVLVVLGSILGVGSISSNVNYFAAAAGLAGIISLLVLAISLVILVFAIIAMVKAYGYKEYHIPLIGGIAAGFAQKK